MVSEGYIYELVRTDRSIPDIENQRLTSLLFGQIFLAKICGRVLSCPKSSVGLCLSGDLYHKKGR